MDDRKIRVGVVSGSVAIGSIGLMNGMERERGVSFMFAAASK